MTSVFTERSNLDTVTERQTQLPLQVKGTKDGQQASKIQGGHRTGTSQPQKEETLH